MPANQTPATIRLTGTFALAFAADNGLAVDRYDSEPGGEYLDIPYASARSMTDVRRGRYGINYDWMKQVYIAA